MKNKPPRGIPAAVLNSASASNLPELHRYIQEVVSYNNPNKTVKLRNPNVEEQPNEEMKNGKMND